jgi:hypothetical protein
MTDAGTWDSEALAAWLDTATRKLSTDSAARVREEIREHFESAREEAVAAGVTADSACLSALASLGDAKTVNRRYRRVLVTAWEATLLERAECADRSWYFSRVGLVARLFVWGAFLFFGVAQENPMLVLVAGGYFAVCGYRLLPARHMRIGGLVIRWIGIPVGIFTGFMIAGQPDVRVALGAMFILYEVAVARAHWGRMRLREKLPVADWPRALYL